jgi:alpha-1,3-mannosyltransferase
MTEHEGISGLRERNILGVAIAVCTRDSAIDAIDSRIGSKTPMCVAFANANTLNFAAGDPIYREILNECFVLNDGVGVNIASKYLYGSGFKQNLNGTDFIPDYLRSTRHKLRVFLLGSTQQVVEQCAARFSRLYDHDIVGARSGFFTAEEEMRTVSDEIRKSGADVVLVGLGNPLQEKWMRCHGVHSGASVLFGVGALLDFAAGKIRRAPLWVRRLRAEWLFRLVQEPGRLWRRYLIGNAAFLIRLLIMGRTA